MSPAILRGSATVAGAGAIVCVLGAVLTPSAMAVSYLVAYTATLAAVLGMLILVMIAHVVGATWFVVLRRQAEAVLGTLPVLAVLAVPLVVWLPAWTSTGALSCGVRGGVYWAIWLVSAEALRRASRRQDADRDPALAARARRVSAAGLPLLALTLTFAAFDWMMSLSRGWSSSIYGMYFFAGAMVGALALLAVLSWRLRRTAEAGMPTAEHSHALGRLMLAFVLFWAYVAFSQFIVVWSADLPREVGWYLLRLRSGWGALGLVVAVAGFAVPFLALLLRAVKRSAAALAAVGFWLLAAHYLDVYWLVAPERRWSWSLATPAWDLGALALVAGAAAAVGLWRQRGVPPVPIGDPLLEPSLRYKAR